jgi:hypothetical protein
LDVPPLGGGGDGALPFGGVPSAGGGAPPGAVLGGVAVGAPDELAFGPVSGVLAGGGVSDGAAGPVDCCFAQPAAIISAAIDIKTRLRFMKAPL